VNSPTPAGPPGSGSAAIIPLIAIGIVRPAPATATNRATSGIFPTSTQADYDKYFTGFAKLQVEELLTNYHPDLLWFDEIDMKTDAEVAMLYRAIRKLQPDCVINSRIKGCRFPEKIPRLAATTSPPATTRSPTGTWASSGKIRGR